MNADSLLHSLNEMPSVEGSCILDVNGKVVQRTLSGLYLDSLLEAIARRSSSVMAATGSVVAGSSELFLQFSLKCIYARQFRGGTLLVLCVDQVRLPSLRVATNLLIKQLGNNIQPLAPAPYASPALNPLSRVEARPDPLQTPQPKKPSTRTGIWG